MEQIQFLQNERIQQNQQIQRMEAQIERNQSELGQLAKCREDLAAVNVLNERLRTEKEGMNEEMEALRRWTTSQCEQAQGEVVRVKQELDDMVLRQKEFEDEIKRLTEEKEGLIVERERESERVRQSESALDV